MIPPRWLDDFRAFWREVRHPTPVASLSGYSSTIAVLRALLPHLPEDATLAVHDPDTPELGAALAAHDLADDRKRAGHYSEVRLTSALLDELAALERPDFSIGLAWFVQVPDRANERSLLQSFDGDLAAFCDLSLGRDVLERVARTSGARLSWPTTTETQDR
jgi:hypothetical protein